MHGFATARATLIAWICAVACAGCRINFDPPASLLVDDANGDTGDSGDSPPCTPVTTGLLGRWPMNAGDVAGTVVLDRTGNGHDGTMVGSPMPTTGHGECWGIQDPGLLDRWVHLAAILRNGSIDTAELYIDGAAQTLTCSLASCTTVRTLSAPVRFGGSDTTYSLRGALDEIRIYDRALTPTEIASLFTDPGCV